MHATIAKAENGFTINTWGNHNELGLTSNGGAVSLSNDRVYVYATLGEALDKVSELFGAPAPVDASPEAPAEVAAETE